MTVWPEPGGCERGVGCGLGKNRAGLGCVEGSVDWREMCWGFCETG